MTNLEELSNHIGGLIKILDPLVNIEDQITNLNGPPDFPSGQIALLLQIIHLPHRYDLYQSCDSSAFPLGKILIVELLLNGTLYVVNIFPPRVELL